MAEDTLPFLLLLVTVTFIAMGVTLAAAAYKRKTLRLNDIIAAQDQIGRSAFNLDATLQLIVDKLQELTGASGAVVELVEGDELNYRTASGTLKNYVGYRLKLATSLSGYCIRTGEVTYSPDTETDNRVDHIATRAVHVRSMVVAPLLNEGNIIGVLKVSSGRVNAFSNADQQTVKLLSGLVSAAIARQQDYEIKQKLLAERSYMALHDTLTDLPNRALFMELLNAAIARLARNKNTVGLMFLDLDGFKEINDRLGHQAGDMLLRQFALRLKETLRDTDCVARLGGDEFTIILENLNSPVENLSLIAHKIITATARPFTLGEHTVSITTSIGIALTSSGKRSAEEVIKSADTELYNAKRKGKNQYSMEATQPRRA